MSLLKRLEQPTGLNNSPAPETKNIVEEPKEKYRELKINIHREIIETIEKDTKEKSLSEYELA